jgi:hypothetical protein
MDAIACGSGSGVATVSFHVPNKYRVRSGYFASDDRFGNNGAFFGARRQRRSRTAGSRR